MKFEIDPKPIGYAELQSIEDWQEYTFELVQHYESIVKAQAELLKRYRKARREEILCKADEDYDALQQAIKEAKS